MTRRAAAGAAVAFATASLLLFGCGEVEESESAVAVEYSELSVPAEEESDESDPYGDFAEVTEEVEAAVMEMDTMEPEDIYSLSLPEFKALLKILVPNFRQLWGVADGELSGEDWENFRRILVHMLWGTSEVPEDKVSFVSTSVSGNSVSGNSLGDNLGELGLSESDFEEISNEELVALVEALSSASAEEFAEGMSFLYEEEENPYASLSEEEAEEARQVMLSVYAALLESRGYTVSGEVTFADGTEEEIGGAANE